ncbi:Sodium-proton antiporter protein [Halorhabdus tiamatea SARL4B]|uniref:Sodium-proton antiporter protein n=1 Tax=Halorhabdus tiamatea SARL4B TaxID=1033806 RepID=U2F4D9_9EURY|nr:Na+/H+ antiporter subunit E [Halorhabdus tiamatea]ERJ05195.1 Sodium-proton antiporter protein [Halorhabdus tiamatea SARL4B]
MRRWPVIGVALAALWLFVNGVELAPMPLAGAALSGLAIGMPIAYLFRRFYASDIAIGGLLRSIPATVIYLVLFLTELITANVDVAYRVLAPSMPIEPDVIEIPLRVESDAAITTIANSISLTPGTLTMDYNPDRNSLYVHAIAGRDRELVVAPIRQWEGYALRIFDEERSPTDPVPDPDAGNETDTDASADTDLDADTNGGEPDGK